MQNWHNQARGFSRGSCSSRPGCQSSLSAICQHRIEYFDEVAAREVRLFLGGGRGAFHAVLAGPGGGGGG